MTYVRCERCGYTAVRGPMSLIGSCPRCRLHGRAVPLVLLVRDTYARPVAMQGGVPTSERE